ncbi:MAG TPA: MFS transporter [Chloroflexota bacterium]|nr:MFS transporter [Chloroflexota bacterium]
MHAPKAGTAPPSSVSSPRFAAFAYRNYRLYWMGQLLGNVGSWMQIVATGWLVLALTDSPASLGLTGALTAVPLIALSLVGGVVADRVDRYRMVVGAQAAQLVPDTVLAVLVGTGQVQVVHVYVYTLVGATIRGLSTPARQAFMPSLVPRAALLSAIALNSILWQGAAVVGPAVAGLVLASWGEPGNFYLNVVSDVANLALLWGIRAAPVGRDPAARSAWEGVREGARYAWGQAQVRALLLAAAGVCFFGMAYSQLMPVFARDVYRVGPEGLGLLLTMPAVGTISAALALAVAGPVARKGRLFLGTALALALGLVAFALCPFYGLALPVLVAIGAATTATLTLGNTLLQQTVAERLRGRVMGFWMACTQGMSPLGALPAGVVAEAIGAPAAIALGAGALLLTLLAVAWPRDGLRALR